MLNNFMCNLCLMQTETVLIVVVEFIPHRVKMIDSFLSRTIGECH